MPDTGLESRMLGLDVVGFMRQWGCVDRSSSSLGENGRATPLSGAGSRWNLVWVMNILKTLTLLFTVKSQGG